MFAASLLAAALMQAAIKTEVISTPSGFELRRDGKPYLVKGVGYQSGMESAAKAGANSIRTWGISDGLQADLDKAHSLGMSVAVGIWMGHERHGFKYDDPAQVKAQFEAARDAIRKYKNHPAVLLWGIGNEMEGFSGGDDPKIWRAINDIAKMAKEEDPNHPTMSVIAEVGPQKIPAIHTHAPDLDIVGINTYGGASSVIKRYKDFGGKKPVLITEFGPVGAWESPKNEWGVALEPTSTEKGEMYRSAYRAMVTGNPGFVLGSYAFLWGRKMEVTATWFGTRLKDGSALAASDALQEEWTGLPPSNRVPVIKKFALKGLNKVTPGERVTVVLEATDPEGDPIQPEWVLKTENTELRQGGDAEPEQTPIPGALVKSNLKEAVFEAPKTEAGYRIFVILRDGKGGAATANIPILVEDPSRRKRGAKVDLPAHVFNGNLNNPLWTPSGFMGQPNNLSVTQGGGASASRILVLSLNATSGWGGIVFQSPEGDWGDKDGGYDLTGAKRLVFSARGQNGGEKVKFEFGILGREHKFYDTARGVLEVVLDKDWKEYEIPLAGKDLSRIKTGFSWVATPEGKPVICQIKYARYE